MELGSSSNTPGFPRGTLIEILNVVRDDVLTGECDRCPLIDSGHFSFDEH